MVSAVGVPLPPLDEHSLLVFWCQILLVLLAARLGGYALRRVGQPRVVGELLAGVALGPSLLGRAWPGGFDWLFPPSQRQAGLLLGLAWVGIVLLLALTGAEMELSTISSRGRAAATTAVGSLAMPLLLGAGVALLLPAGFVGPDGTRAVFVAFLAVAFAISSLPVAARVLGDLGLLHRPFAQLALTVATLNDIVGWVLLGSVASVAESGRIVPLSLIVALLGVVLIAVVAIRLGPAALDALDRAITDRSGGPTAEASAIVLVVVALGTLTHAIGIEAVIGAFIAGVAIAGSRLRHGAGFAAIETVTNAVFAPLFFAVAGLRVDLTSLTWSLLGWIVLVTVAASVAKLVGSYAGGRLGGLEHVDALGVGCVLNARGALEIVVATVGITLGVINGTAYTVIVAMAVLTTAMTGPLLRWSQRRPVGDLSIS